MHDTLELVLLIAALSAETLPEKRNDTDSNSNCGAHNERHQDAGHVVAGSEKWMAPYAKAQCIGIDSVLLSTTIFISRVVGRKRNRVILHQLAI
jgi:hypothetical protein